MNIVYVYNVDGPVPTGQRVIGGQLYHVRSLSQRYHLQSPYSIEGFYVVRFHFELFLRKYLPILK